MLNHKILPGENNLLFGLNNKVYMKYHHFAGKHIDFLPRGPTWQSFSPSPPPIALAGQSSMISLLFFKLLYGLLFGISA